MRDSETTNLLLLLILLVLIIGFGFLAPILWAVGAVLGVWITVIIIRAITKGAGAGIDAVGGILGRAFRNNAVQWCLIVAPTGFLIWKYVDSGKTAYLHPLVIPAVFALFKGISYWDTVSARKKYRS